MGRRRVCGFFGKEQAGTLKPTDVYLFRVAQMLGEYAVHGAVLRRYNRSVSKLDAAGAETVARFQEHLRAAGRSASTVRTYGTLAGEFVAFTGTRGGLGCCDAAMIGAFVATLAGYQFKTVEQKLCAVRSFLRFACAAGLVDGACLEAVPAARSARQARIPSVWDPGEVARIVEAIDRDNPCGKRDYAIILLITRLGLRGVDIRRLEFADFDWPGNRLFVTQAKTGHRVQLPLLKEVGWAVIDYIRHGRPDCDCPQVFVRHTGADRPVLRPGSSASDPGQACPGGARAGERETPPWHALAAAYAGDPADGKRHTGRADRRHPRSPVRRVDRRLPEILSGPAGQVRAGPGRAGERGVAMSPAITMTERDHGPGHRKTRHGLQVRRRGAGAGPVRRVLRQLSSPGWQAPTRASVEAWIAAARQRGVTPATLHSLAAPVRELARWLGRRGVAAYVLPAGALPRPARYVPHIYTDQELAALFTQTDRCHYDSQVPFRHLVMPVLFRTIYACGLRASEARLLRFDDVDLDAGVLTIRDGKGGKDRQVPVSARAARQAGRLPRPRRRAHRRGLVLPRHRRAPADDRQHRQELPPVPVAGPHSPRRPGPRPPRPRSATHHGGQQSSVVVRRRRGRRRVAAGPADLHGSRLHLRHRLLPEADRRVLPAHHHLHPACLRRRRPTRHGRPL